MKCRTDGAPAGQLPRDEGVALGRASRRVRVHELAERRFRVRRLGSDREQRGRST